MELEFFTCVIMPESKSSLISASLSSLERICGDGGGGICGGGADDGAAAAPIAAMML